uniref:Iron-sulfur cluster-binding domain-containing protein n=1 Tax=Candidatus Kentrum sp. FW TaxID=2126338 RepID=A0A450TP59_9GAMM|nr:MAG: Iron-sulfur cluster-binding domain-containing protein [Candidatus Kentron sp. FW]
MIERIVRHAREIAAFAHGAADAELMGLAEEIILDAGALQLPGRREEPPWPEVAVPGTLLAARLALREGLPQEAIELAQDMLSRHPLDLYIQRLVNDIHLALGLPGWTRADEDDLARRFCDYPFTRFETNPDGDIRVCCKSWLSVPIGNLTGGHPREIWNSEPAAYIRRSILDGRFTYCSRARCPKILNRVLPYRDELTEPFQRDLLETGSVVLGAGPRDIKLNHDYSCNLSCPSCRSAVITAGSEERARLDRAAESLLFPLLEEARVVEITGSGDPFASAHFKGILKRISRTEFPDLMIDLFTNGQLFTKKMWDHLELAGLCRRVVVSVDAVEPDTYHCLRRGGDWTRLMRNLDFIAELRRAGEFQRVVLVFVVQRENYRQIPDFIRLTRRFGFDEAFLQMIARWSQPVAEYEQNNVGLPDHPLHGDFLKVLRDPTLKDPVVNLGTMKTLYEEALE